MNRTDKQFLSALAVTPCGETTEQVTTPTGGKAPDAGVRKASAMHAANATKADKQIVQEQALVIADLERLQVSQERAEEEADLAAAAKLARQRDRRAKRLKKNIAA